MAYKTKADMKTTFTLFLSILFSSFLLGQGCPTSVKNGTTSGRLFFCFASGGDKTNTWNAISGLTITGGTIGTTPVTPDPLFILKADMTRTSQANDYFRTDAFLAPTEAIGAPFTGTITLQYANGDPDLACEYDVDGILPVELVRFDAEKQGKKSLLSWTTASEINNDGFEIEISSNGKDWKVLAWVNGIGNADKLNNYTYLDKDPFNGKNYYRLKQIDYDGRFDFSDVVTLQYDVKNIMVEVSPNPSPGEVNVTVLNPNKEKMNIVLYDSAGLIIWKSATLSNLDIWNKEFNLTKRGMHSISVQIGKEVSTKKILILD